MHHLNKTPQFRLTELTRLQAILMMLLLALESFLGPLVGLNMPPGGLLGPGAVSKCRFRAWCGLVWSGAVWCGKLLNTAPDRTRPHQTAPGPKMAFTYRTRPQEAP